LPLTIRRHCLTLALFVLAPQEMLAQAHFPANDDVQLMLRYLVEDGETPGIVIGFLEADGSRRILEYGDPGPGARPLGPRSAFEIGSITKTFTGTLLADMVRRGEMALDDPVQKYLPDGVTMPMWEGREITLLDLSTHHSGLPRMPDNFEPADRTNPYADYGPDQLYAFLTDHELRREPGSEYEYSNLAVGLLGHVLELATGMSYGALVRQRILDPLGMSTSGVTLEGDLADWMTKGHDDAGTVTSYWDAMALVGAGGIRSNAEDMLTYLDAQLGPAESEIEQAMRLTHESRVEMDNGVSGGLGWASRRVGERRVFTHGGGTGGYSTLAGFDPDLGVAVVMLTNTGDFDDDLAADLLRRGAPISTPTVEVPGSVLENYVGVYGPAAAIAAAVRLEDEGWLTVQTPGNVRFRLYADSDTSFYTRRTPWRFKFQTGSDGEISGFVADLEGSVRTMPRQDAEIPDARVLAGNPLPSSALPALTEEEMARYEGEYSVTVAANVLSFRVFVEGGALMAQPAGQRSAGLLHQGDHTFVVAIDTDIRLVFELEDGRAENVTFTQNGQSATGRRLAPGETPPAPPPEPEVLDLPVTAADIARYEGTYLLPVGERTMELRIFGRDGALISQAAGQNEAPLRHQGDHVFVPDFDEGVRIVFTVEDARATSLTLHQGGAVFQGERQPDEPETR
jgi:D-alanyl-D-alanine-carboxypeptidase/D-alanyl-D-alanine-endopeptidase